MTSPEAQKGRLPITVVPYHYDLNYTNIDLDRHVFDGHLTMHMRMQQMTTTKENEEAHDQEGSTLLLHCLELQILSCHVTSVDSNQTDETTTAADKGTGVEFRYNIQHQTVEIILDDAFPGWKPGVSYTAQILFSGILNDQMRGFYRSTYTGLDGTSQRTMATTQFQATDARRAFPCIDEPAHKATFQLVVTIPAHLQCISNTPLESVHTTTVSASHTGTNRPSLKSEFIKTITFQKTPKMSTYLLAFVIGEFDAISKTKLISHSLPLIKSDLLAIPDFAAGAMENWGCVTYREAKILVQEGSTSETMRRGIARTVCHELAHQWFGNLVTMEFWTQLWLNEGFARFMEFVAIDTLFPDWDAWTEFVQSVFGVAQSLDAMKSSHPVEVEVQHPDEIQDIFDAISYAKGASLIRMISSYIGFDIFMEGLKIYLQRHAYGNATTDMLWQALEEASNKPVAKLMTPWTLQTGYPLLLLTSSGMLETPRFLASGPESDTHDASSWPIPVTAIVEGDDQVHGPWLIHGPDGDETPALLEAIQNWTEAGKWFKLNANQTAFVRVAYTPEQWKRLSVAMVPNGQLSAIDRLGLISDSFAAGRSGYSSIVDSLRLVENFGQHETADYAVWQELSENLGDLCRLYRSQPFFSKFQSYLIKIYTKQFDILGWDAKDGESQRTGTLRASVISMMGRAGDESICAEAHRRFCDYVTHGIGIPGDLQGIVFRLALRYDEAQVYPSLRNLYEASTFPEEQRNCLSAMGSVQDRGRHLEMLEYTLFSGKVRLQDIAFPLGALSSASDDGGRACWDFFSTHYNRFLSAGFAGGPMWGACVGFSCRGLKTLDEANQVEAYFVTNPPGSARTRLIQGLEAIRTRAIRLARDEAAVAAFLDEQGF
ncbi:metalloaminopeptidase [Fragilaria crotonensis]|nr:metalloaminopeptidase [Fragilaria crotonensis]